MYVCIYIYVCIHVTRGTGSVGDSVGEGRKKNLNLKKKEKKFLGNKPERD